MNQVKTFKILVIVLVIMNVGLATFMWIGRPPRPFEDGPRGPRRGREGGMNPELIHELHFTEAQVKQFDILFDDHQEKMEPIKNRGRELHNLLFEQLNSNDATSDSIIQLIASNRAEGEKLLFAHLQKVRGLCNEQQKNKFDQLIKGAMERMDRH